MTATLLLDLDGTLLINEMGAFVAAYTRALGKHLVSRVEPARMVQTLMAATQIMSQNLRPDRTLKDSFDAAFYPQLGLSEAEMRGTLEAFYQEIFPSLKSLTHPNPETAGLVQEAVQRGYRIGIATNPIFPRTAILQRIEWAGVDPDLPAIDLISSYETFHFAKPSLAYYAEFLALMGWPEGPVVMIGNDPDSDISPARRLGLAAYYTPEDNSPYPPVSSGLAPTGSLAGLMDWLDLQPPENLQPDFSSPEALLAVLRSTPAALNTMAQELPPEALTYCAVPGEWCMAEVTCHMRDVDAEVNLPRLDKMLKEKNPFLAGMDTDAWVSERQYIIQDCTESLEAFVSNRIQLLSLLETLQPEDWERPARHAILGPTRLQELVSIIAAHDRLHVQQIFKTLPSTNNGR